MLKEEQRFQATRVVEPMKQTRSPSASPRLGPKVSPDRRHFGGVLRLRCFAHVVKLILVLAPLAVSNVHARSVNATTAEQCSSVSTCAYFSDVYSGTPRLQYALSAAFRAARIVQPQWIKNGTNTPMSPVLIEGKIYLLGSVCEPHNCPHQVVVLYAASDGELVAAYDNGQGKQVYLGNPSEKQKRALSDYRSGSSKLRRLLDSRNSPLPVPID